MGLDLVDSWRLLFVLFFCVGKVCDSVGVERDCTWGRKKFGGEKAGLLVRLRNVVVVQWF